MKRHGIFAACATAALSLLSIGAVAQQQSPKEQLVGTWTFVSWERTEADGTTLRQFGVNHRMTDTMCKLTGEAPMNMCDFVKLHAVEFKQRGPAHAEAGGR